MLVSISGKPKASQGARVAFSNPPLTSSCVLACGLMALSPSSDPALVWPARAAEIGWRAAAAWAALTFSW